MSRRYGKAWEKFPIEPGEVWSNDRATVSVADLTEEPPGYLTQADLVYCDPPWTLGNVNMFNGFAEREYMDRFDEFVEPFFQLIDTINPRVCFVEVGVQSLDLFRQRLDERFGSVQTFEITYYRKHRCYLLRGGEAPTTADFAGLDDVDTPGLAVQSEECSVVADPCMGRGLTALAALDHGKRFVGTELNKRKLAVFLERMEKRGCSLKAQAV